MKKILTLNNELSIDEFAELVEEYCNKYGWIYKEDFGLVLIHTKYESWCFELTNGKIKLMHKNSRYSANGDYHVQWKKMVSCKYLIHYIRNHENKRYLKPTKSLVCT